MGSGPAHLPAPPPTESAREIAERLWREQFEDEEEEEATGREKCAQRMAGNAYRAKTRAPKGRSSVVAAPTLGEVLRSAQRREGARSVPIVPSPEKRALSGEDGQAIENTEEKASEGDAP